MKKILIFLLGIFLFTGLILAESGSSTSNLFIYDNINQVMKRVLTQDGTYDNLRIAIFEDADVVAVMQINQDGVSVSTFSLAAASFLFGFDGTNWNRLQSDVTNFLIVHTSTDSDVNIYNNGNRARVIQGNSDAEVATDYGLLVRGALLGYNETTGVWARLRSNEMNHLEVRTDTNAVVMIHYQNAIAVVEDTSADGIANDRNALLTLNHLYGYNKDLGEWDRLRSDALYRLEISTDNLFIVADYTTHSWLDKLYTLTSTGTHTLNNSLRDIFNREKDIVITSGVITRVEDIMNIVASSDTKSHAYLISIRDRLKAVVISSGVITTVEDIAGIVATSDTISHTYLINIRDRLKAIVISSGVITSIEDIAGIVATSDTTSHTYLINIRDRLKAVVISSGVITTVQDIANIVASSDTKTHGYLINIRDVLIGGTTVYNKVYDGVKSTGTTLAVGTGASVTYTPQTSVIEIWIDPHEDNTDEVRMRFYNEDVISCGTPINTKIIIDTWHLPIYFQSETGNQVLIINEIYE